MARLNISTAHYPAQGNRMVYKWQVAVVYNTTSPSRSILQGISVCRYSWAEAFSVFEVGPFQNGQEFLFCDRTFSQGFAKQSVLL
jgi:hypothetical protein